MRLDYLTIFPGWFDPLALSLPGRAVASGLLEVHVHDLRDWTHDKHRTVDDTPAGGGAGMVMRPEPWGEALDALGVLGADGAGATPGGGTTLVVPTPAGEPLTQPLARELATRERLVFACGRYEGIDQRVLDLAATEVEVREISLGDYVLNGGEVAALAITEAVVRLLPGFMGNAASLEEESHEHGLLEHPVYTRPASWRGLDVPPVLLSGDHGAIAAWRAEQARRRTAERRPDLLAPASVPGGGELRHAVPGDVGELYTLQLACWVAEQHDNPGVRIPALHETLEDAATALGEWTVLVLRRHGRLVAAGRGRLDVAPDGEPEWDVGRLMVAPDARGQGLGRFLLAQVEACAPAHVRRFSLFTGEGSRRNQRMYRKAGYRLDGPPPEPGAVRMTKRVRTTARGGGAPAS